MPQSFEVIAVEIGVESEQSSMLKTDGVPPEVIDRTT